MILGTRNVFSGNPIIPGKRDNLSTQALENLLKRETLHSKSGAKVLPVYDGKPLVTASLGIDGRSPEWRLAWIPLDAFSEKLDIPLGSTGTSSYDRLVYLGERNGTLYLGLDVSPPSQSAVDKDKRSSGAQLAAETFSSVLPDDVAFVELRTLMVGAYWDDEEALGELSIAGHVCDPVPNPCRSFIAITFSGHMCA